MLKRNDPNYHVEWRKNNKEKVKEWDRLWRLRVRSEVITHYGGKCICCGEANDVFLTIDHINNDGAAHRKTKGGTDIYKLLRKEGYPNGFQILCWNCNYAKFRGSCPHGQ